MRSTQMPLRSEALLSLLEFASLTRDSPRDSLLVFSALQQQPQSLPARAYLLLLRQQQPHRRLDTLRRALADTTEPAELLRVQAALVLVLASGGDGERSAAWLSWLHAEGVDLSLAAGNGLAALLRLPGAAGQSQAGQPALGSDDGLTETGGEDAVDESNWHAAANDEGGQNNLWVAAIEACGESVDSARAICAAMEAANELEPASGLGVDALLALLAVCARGADVDEAVATLGQMGPAAPAEAYVRVVETAAASRAEDEEAGLPSMHVATATLDLMQEADALADASAAQLLRLFCALVSGFGRLADLDSAYSAFLEGCEWLERRREEALGEEAVRDRLHSLGMEADAVRLTDEERWWMEAERSLYQARRTRGRAVPGIPHATAAHCAAARSSPPSLDPYAASPLLRRRQTMVDAAAPHPRGLLLACKLLEQLQSRSGQRLSHGYYRQLINGHATAHELSSALTELQGAWGGSFASPASWRVSDSTVASLMEARRRPLSLSSAALAAAQSHSSRAHSADRHMHRSGLAGHWCADDGRARGGERGRERRR